MIKVFADRIVLEDYGFRLTLEPLLALRGYPEEIREIRDLGGGFLKILYNTGSAILSISKTGEVYVVSAQVGSGLSSKVIAKVRLSINGYSRGLIFHFTYDPPEYLQGEDEPYRYPVALDIGDDIYCPWSYPWHINKLDELPEKLKVSQVLLHGDEYKYLFLLPISNCGARAYISEISSDKFTVLLDSMRETSWRDIHILAISFSENPYRAIEEAYTRVFSLLGKERNLRRYKQFPECLKYLGWCTWNAFWRDIAETKILQSYENILRKNIPIKFLLLDDGWMATENGMINSFDADPEKFPSGLAGLVAELKKRGLKYFGLWHTLNGYWNGINPQGDIAGGNRELIVSLEDMVVPHPSKSYIFFDKWYSFLSVAGVDLVKVDNQYILGYVYPSMSPVEKASEEIHRGLEAAACVNGLDILNCMAQNPEHYFNWYISAIARSSIDYVVPQRKSRNKLHLYFNAYNSLWMSQIVWPDWDMFQTHDPWALQQAVARAVSGGPVYITDEPGKVVPEIAKKLALSDGRIPRPDIPALPTPDTVMKDPYNEPIPLKVFTRVAVEGVGSYGVVAVFNIYREDKELEYELKVANALLPAGRYLIYEYFSRRYSIANEDTVVRDRLEPMGVHLYFIAPLSRWVVPIGLEEAYLSPATLEKVVIAENKAHIWLRDKGALILYAAGRVEVDSHYIEAGKLAVIEARDKYIVVKNLDS